MQYLQQRTTISTWTGEKKSRGEREKKKINAINLLGEERM